MSREGKGIVDLEYLLGQALQKAAGDVAHVMGVWSTIVGQHVAAAASPTSLREGVLKVSCTSSVWANELTHMSPEILARLRSELPSLKLERMHCVSGGRGEA